MREGRILTPANGIALPEASLSEESTIFKNAETSGSKVGSHYAVKLKGAEVKEMEIAASKYQRQHDMGLAKMRYKLKKRRLGLLERKRVDRRARHDDSHKNKMAKLKLRRLKAKLRHTRSGLFNSHEERMAELKARMLEIELARKAGTDGAAEHRRGWKALVPSWAMFLVGRDISDALRLVQNIHAGVTWAPRAASDLRRWASRSE